MDEVRNEGRQGGEMNTSLLQFTTMLTYSFSNDALLIKTERNSRCNVNCEGFTNGRNKVTKAMLTKNKQTSKATHYR